MKKGLRLAVHLLSHILKTDIVGNIDLTKKGLRRAHSHAQEFRREIAVRNRDLVKKGLRRLSMATLCAPTLTVRNEDLTKKGLRLYPWLRPHICLLW